MKRVAVLGTGQMGGGIAQVLAQMGHEVLLWNRTQKSLEVGLQAIRKAVDRLLQKERITALDHRDTLARLRGIVNPEEWKAADIVIEAVP